ncbi:MAG: IPT/TIG domain-containing protein [Hymenobacteraceae bacterium]|nr:IPT/TIG domain-containing protein [Hymenobacteraceae bacterium]
MTKLYAARFTVARMQLHLLLLLLTLFLPAVALADDRQHMVPVSLEERIREADMIVEGEVVAQQSFWDARHENIYTSNIIRVYKVFKGSVQAGEVELITEGGTVGLKKHVFSTALELRQGQQGMFFLKKEQQLSRTPNNRLVSARAYASRQGLIRYDLARGTAADVFETYNSVQEVYQRVSDRTGQEYRTVNRNERLQQIPFLEQKQQQNTLLVPVISSFTPTVASAGTGTILIINGSGFGNSRGNGFVEFRNADDGGQTFIRPLPTEYISWSNSQIRLYIPSRGRDGGTAGTGEIRVTASDGSITSSAQRLTIEYVYSNINIGRNGQSFKPYLVNTDGQGGYTIQFAPSMQSRNPAQEGFRRAMNSWICNTSINWNLGSPSNLERATDDGRNIVRFAPASETGQGVLARTVSRYDGCIVNNTDTLLWLSEFDMEINSNITWQFGPGPPVNRQYDFETVMLHELGHAHQLGHVILPRALMHYAVEFEILVRDLSPVDIRAGNFVMARSTGAEICSLSPGPIEPELEGDCNLAPEIYTFEAAYQGGQVQVRWQAQNEQNVASYVVQRSETGTNWQDIGTVSRRDNGTGIQEYSFVDTNPLPDVSFYRLQVVYSSDESSFSPRVRVLDPASLRVLRVYPNPIGPERGSVSLLYLVQATANMTIQLYSSTGQLVKDYNVTFTDVNLPVELPLDGLAAGTYIMKWSERGNGGEVRILKL